MRINKLIVVCFVFSILVLLPSIVLADPEASILYTETYSSGYWEYNFTFYNNSTSNYDLYSVQIILGDFYTINDPLLPTGWAGQWGTSNPSYIMETHTNAPFYIAPSDSTGGFSFTVDYQLGALEYNAFFIDGSDNIKKTTGFAEVVPEPLSSVLFLIGVAVFGFRRFLRKRIQ
jgi:hypothetical protein